MKILVINCGSSSLKYQLLDMKDESVLCKGSIERIGLKINGGEEKLDILRIKQYIPLAINYALNGA